MSKGKVSLYRFSILNIAQIKRNSFACTYKYIFCKIVLIKLLERNCFTINNIFYIIYYIMFINSNIMYNIIFYYYNIQILLL